ncbi:MAG: hypothetical protein KDA41_20070 [Planctomycetales bacterium]|nr:hypothetical protein [Planctomycetales bacterium]
MTCKWRTAMVALTMVALCGGSVVAAPPTLADDVMPLLKIRCVRCHGPAKQEGGLNLSLPQSIARGGDSGAGGSRQAPRVCET